MFFPSFGRSLIRENNYNTQNIGGKTQMIYTSYSTREVKKKKGRVWQARLSYKDPASGKWKKTEKFLPEAKGKREANTMAKELMDRLNSESNTTEVVNDTYRTISEVFERYIDYQLKNGLIERSTHHLQELAFKKNIEPYLGNVVFNTLDRNLIIDWQTRLNNRGIQQATIYSNAKILKKLYNHYKIIGEIDRNPFDTIKIQKDSKPRITHMTEEQMNDYVADVYLEFEPEDKMFAACLLLYYLGLRRGECCALRWRNIDWKNKIIHIDSAIGVCEGGNYTKHPKNTSSIRKIPMIPQVEQFLTQRYNAINPEPHWFVCGDGEHFYRTRSLNKRFHDFVRRYNLVDAYGNYLTPHSLRHNLGTVGINSGMDIASLSAMLGHASKAMTLDVYGDSDTDAKIVASNKLSQKFKETDLDE